MYEKQPKFGGKAAFCYTEKLTKQEKKALKEKKLLREIIKRPFEDEDAGEQITKKPKLNNNKPKGREYTISIAIPASILNNAKGSQSAFLVGQIARAATVCNVDEIVVFYDLGSIKKSGINEVLDKKAKCSYEMKMILDYLECPQYLRKTLFKTHDYLKNAGLLPPLNAPHHLRRGEESMYREGIVLDKTVKLGKGSFVDVGLLHEIQVDQQVQAGVRVTVKMGKGKKSKGMLVSPSEPRKKEGMYWGYQTRLARNLSAVLTDSNLVTDDGSPGYDCVIGTSDKGDSVDDICLPKFKHLVVVFGGLDGLEDCLEADEVNEELDPKRFFQYYLNTYPGQGSRTIRTEEAVGITLSILRPKIAESISS